MAEQKGPERIITIPDAVPGAAPGLGLGEILRWYPIIEQVITTVESAIAGGATQIPLIKLHVAGKHLELGPTPIKISA